MAKPSVVISTPGGDPLAKLARFERAVYLGASDAVTSVCLLTKSLAQTALRDLGRVDRGTLRNSITASVVRKPDEVRGVVSADAFYAIWVEFGRRGSKSSPPGVVEGWSATAAWPPPPVIAAWVARNLAKLRAGGKGSGKAPASVESLAFMIGRKVAERGIKPSPFMRPAEAYARPRFQGILVDAVLKRRAAAGV